MDSQEAPDWVMLELQKQNLGKSSSDDADEMNEAG